MKVALVHDYLSDFGGAERVLLALLEMFPEAPIYTAYYKTDSPAYQRFKNRKVIASWAQKIPFFHKLASPLRFLAPLIWESFDFRGFDLVISSASWFITKGIIVPTNTLHISYIHTPPRYLYGYETSIDFQKNIFTNLYAKIVNPFLRKYDFLAAQRPDILAANSENTRQRIKKFYHRDATVIYPPVELPTPITLSAAEGSSPDSNRDAINIASLDSSSREAGLRMTGNNYFLVVSRIVGGKGLKMAVQACAELNLPLKVVGQPAGWSREYSELKKMANSNMEFLGAVSDEKLVQLYSGAQAFIAIARDEDFGITPVEAMLCGTPVIAYRGGGYLETVIDGKTGIFFDEYTIAGLKKAINSYKKQETSYKPEEIRKHAQKFSKERFIKKIRDLIIKETSLS